MTEWLKWIKSTNIDPVCAEGMVIDKNSCLCGASIIVRGKQKKSKDLSLEHWGDSGRERSGVWFFGHVLLQSLTDPGGEAK